MDDKNFQIQPNITPLGEVGQTVPVAPQSQPASAPLAPLQTIVDRHSATQQLPNQLRQPVPAVQPTTPETTLEEDGKQALTILHQHNNFVRSTVVIIALLLTIGDIFMIYHVLAVRRQTYNDLSSVQAMQAQKNLGSAVQDRPDGTLDMTHTVNNSLSAKDQDLKAHLKQQINLADGTTFMVTAVQKDWKPLNGKGFAPQAGNYYLKLSMVIGNRTNTATTSVSSVVANLSIETKGHPSSITSASTYLPLNDAAELGVDATDLGFYSNNIQSAQTVNGVLIIQVPSGTLPSLIVQRDGLGYDKDGKLGTVIMKATVDLND